MTGITRPKVELQFDGKEFSIKPTFASIDAVEQRIGVAMLSARMQMSDVRIRDMAAVIHGCLVANGHTEYTYAQVGEIILEENNGIDNAVDFASRFLEAVLAPGPEEPIEGEGQSEAGEGKD